MFKNLFKKFDGCITDWPSKLGPEEKFFSNVVGYSDIKKLLLKSTISKDPIHILLTGPPSSAKTLFLLEMLRGLEGAYFIDAVGMSGPGMMECLFAADIKYLLIDEIDKMKKGDQAFLLNVMETGILSETKAKGRMRQKKIKLWVFATSNDTNSLTKPLRSRFLELHMHEYTYEEFTVIVKRLVKERYKLDLLMAEKIANCVWNKKHSRDIRDAIDIAKLARTPTDVDWLVDVQIKYGNNN